MESVLIESRVPAGRSGLLRRVSIPLVWIKNTLSRLHVWLLSMLWDELIRGKTTGDNVGNIVAAVAFLGLSLFVYHFQDGIDYCVLALVVVWALDYLWVQWGSDVTRRRAKIVVHTDGERLRWQRTQATGDHQVVTLNRNELGGVVINRLHVERGLLEAVWRTEWQVYLTPRDKSHQPLLVAVEPKLRAAYRVAMRLGTALSVPISIIGESADPRQASSKVPAAVTPALSPTNKQNDRRTTISTRISVSGLRRLIGSVLAESGLLLFLLVLTAVMKWFGEVVHFYVVPLLGLGSTRMTIHTSLGGLIGIFRPDIDWRDTVEITIAMGIVLLTGLRYTHRHTLIFTATSIEHFRGRRRKATLRRAQVGRLHYVAAPFPVLVIADGNDVVAIDLPARREDFAALVASVRAELGGE